MLSPQRSYTVVSPGDFTHANLSSQADLSERWDRRMERSATNAVNAVVVHVIERSPGDFVPNNMVYHRLQELNCLPLAPLLQNDSELLTKKQRAFVEQCVLAQHAENDAAADNADDCCHAVPQPISEEAHSPFFDTIGPTALLRQFTVDSRLEWSHGHNMRVTLCNRVGEQTFLFYPFKIDVAVSIPFASAHFAVLVNLKPVVPGHLLVVPRRIVPAIPYLTPEEIDDWGKVVKLCFLVLRCREDACCCRRDGFSVGTQQGADAGQTVPHLHTHIIPYDSVGELAGEPEDEAIEQERRKPRTTLEMKAETDLLKPMFAELAPKVGLNQ
jgi:bis(5'-adenosyl)-triphosphatase